MRKLLLLSLISAFLITSCNLFQRPVLITTTPLVPQEPVSTAVAATLTANPLAFPSQPVTPIPPATSTATQVTPTATNTLEPSNTPEFTSTPTFTSTPDDITSSLGQPTCALPQIKSYFPK